MTQEEKKKVLYNFGMEVLKDVAVQTHTNWEVYFLPLVEKYIKKI